MPEEEEGFLPPPTDDPSASPPQGAPAWLTTPPPGGALAVPPPAPIKERPIKRTVAKEEILKGVAFERGAVAFLDILGTKGVHEDRVLREEVAIRQELVSDLVADVSGRVFKEIGSFLHRWGKNASDALADSETVERDALAFSDSIVVLARRVLSPEGVIGVLANELSEVVLKAARKGVFLRGAIAYGDFYLGKDASILLGPAVVDAHEWSEAADWIGVCLTPSALYAWKSFGAPEGSAIRERMVPLKEGPRRMGVVDWADKLRADSEALDSLRRELMAAFAKRPISIRDEAKYRNTLSFLEPAE